MNKTNKTTKVCENCTAYLLCTKVTVEEDNKPACKKFENNFPENN